MKRVLLIRHAQCEMNLACKGFVGGQSNASPLTALGQQQAAALGRHLSKHHPFISSTVFCSTAVRAQDTAAIMLQQWEQPPAQLVSSPALLELSQGEWEGKPRHECYTEQVLAEIAADNWNFAAPGGESQRQLEQRVAAFVTEAVLPVLEYGGPPALVVSHGLAIKCFLRGILGSDPGMTWKIALDNTSITEVAFSTTSPAVGWHLLRVNDTTHLALAGLPSKPAE